MTWEADGKKGIALKGLREGFFISIDYVRSKGLTYAATRVFIPDSKCPASKSHFDSIDKAKRHGEEQATELLAWA